MYNDNSLIYISGMEGNFISGPFRQLLINLNHFTRYNFLFAYRISISCQPGRNSFPQSVTMLLWQIILRLLQWQASYTREKIIADQDTAQTS
jgi:hypothetical protein